MLTPRLRHDNQEYTSDNHKILINIQNRAYDFLIMIFKELKNHNLKTKFDITDYIISRM